MRRHTHRLALTLAGLIASAAAFAAEPAMAQEAAPAAQGQLALEPIGGYTEGFQVSVVTTALCPSTTTNLVIRISGGGFKPDSNVIANTVFADLPRTADRTGYIVPIFSDWEYLAVSHGARTPLNGPADLTLLCSDRDQEHIDSRMAGHVRFESHAGEKSTYLQDSGPRIATGLFELPAPGNAGVPLDAPTVPPVASVPGQPELGAGPGPGGGTEQAGPNTAAQQPQQGDEAEATEQDAPASQSAEPGSSPDEQDQVTVAAQRAGGTRSSSLVIASVAAFVGVVSLALLVYIRRPRPGGSTHV